MENRYGPLESLCEECDQIDCSNAMHDSFSQGNISEFESRGLNVANVM